MAASSRRKRSASPGGSRAGWRRLAENISPSLLVGVALVVLFVAGSVWAWHRWDLGESVRSQNKLALENIQITEQPPWIRCDVKAEAFRDGSLGELSALDWESAYKVCRAFELHAWVGKVNRVSKLPQGRMVVAIQYRRPVAWVEVPSILSPHNEEGVLPVDAEAVLLPPEDFPAETVEQFLRISVSDLSPWGPVGTAWPDPRVLGATQIAALVEKHRQPLQLHRILVSSATTASRRQPEPFYELTTRQGHRFIWGSAPGQEDPGEPAAQLKVELLGKLAASPGGFQHESPAETDLRRVEPVAPLPRAARRGSRATR